MTDSRDQAINQFWDDFVAGRQAPTDLDVHSAEAIAALHSLNTASTPEAARERVRQRISSETNLKESKMSALTLAPPGSNGRVALPLSWRQQAGSFTPRFNRRTMLAAAAVLLILLGSIGSYFTLGPGQDRFFGGGSDTAPALIPAQQATPGTDWPMYRGNAGRTGVMPGTGPKIMPGEVWRVQLDGSAFRSPIVVGDTAYVGTAQGILYALGAATGTEKWQFQGDSALEMTPAYLDGVVYVPSQLGTLYAIDAATGEAKWQFAKPLAEFATPTVGRQSPLCR